MSESDKWRKIGEGIGERFAAGINALGLGDTVRAHFAAKYGVCRRCEVPLGGPSPEQVCEGCHADEALGAMGPPGADA